MRCCSRPSAGTIAEPASRVAAPPDVRRVACAFLLAALVAGCATAPPSPAPPFEPALASAFDVAGRFSARRGTEAVAGRFTWSHAPAEDVLLFAAPTGQALARLSGGGAAGVTLESADGRTVHAADWAALTTEAIGVPVPVEGLAWWIRGAPRPGAPHDVERDASGRPSLLRQDGWQVVYAWGEGARLVRLQLTYPDVELRLALDRE